MAGQRGGGADGVSPRLVTLVGLVSQADVPVLFSPYVAVSSPHSPLVTTSHNTYACDFCQSKARRFDLLVSQAEVPVLFSPYVAVSSPHSPLGTTSHNTYACDFCQSKARRLAQGCRSAPYSAQIHCDRGGLGALLPMEWNNGITKLL